MSGTDADDLRLVAGEFVLGVLTADEMRAVRLQSRGSPELAHEITTWETQLLPLAASVTPVQPPDALWDRLEEAIAPLAPPVAAGAANDDAPDDRARGPARARRAVRFWRAATGLSLALAAGLAALAFLRTEPHGPPAQFAAIAPVGAPAAAFVASAQPDGTVVLTSVAPAPVPAGRDLELWILPPGAAKVAPLGVLAASGGSVRLPGAPATGTQLLISLEPAGGSPTGQPTGPVLYGGMLTSV